MTTQEADAKPTDVVDGMKVKVAASSLDKETQSLVRLIFDNDMFSDAMKNMDIGECPPSVGLVIWLMLLYHNN